MSEAVGNNQPILEFCAVAGNLQTLKTGQWVDLLNGGPRQDLARNAAENMTVTGDIDGWPASW